MATRAFCVAVERREQSLGNLLAVPPQRAPLGLLGPDLRALKLRDEKDLRLLENVIRRKTVGLHKISSVLGRSAKNNRLVCYTAPVTQPQYDTLLCTGAFQANLLFRAVLRELIPQIQAASILRLVKRLLILVIVVGVLGIAGYTALSNWTVDVNPASIANSMSPDQRAEACNALSGGTEGGFAVCMEGMDLASQGIQNPVIPDLRQPAEWANFKPGYTLSLRNSWVDSFASGAEPVFGACMFDILASSVEFARFDKIRQMIKSGTSPDAIPEISLAIADCQNGTFYSLKESTPSSNTGTVAPTGVVEDSSGALPYATERNEYWNAKCPPSLRPNETLPIVKCDKGEGVRFVQELLGVESDSFFGNDTFNALIDFQSSNGLPLTGSIDEETWRALDPMQSGPGLDLNSDGLITPDEFYSE